MLQGTTRFYKGPRIGVQIQGRVIQRAKRRRSGGFRGVRKEFVDDVLKEQVFLAQEFQILGSGTLKLKSTIHVGLCRGEQRSAFLLVSLDNRHSRRHEGTDLMEALRSHWDSIRVDLPDSRLPRRKAAGVVDDGGGDHKLRIGQDGIRRAPEDGR